MAWRVRDAAGGLGQELRGPACSLHGRATSPPSEQCLQGVGGGAWAAGEYMLTEGSSLGAALSRSLGWWEQ